MLRASLLWLCLSARTASAYTALPKLQLGDFLIQRSIQQQLYYSAQMRNEPMVNWLKKFQGHEHLDSRRRSEGNCGLPGTYCAIFDQLQVTPFPLYLLALGTEPDSVIEVRYRKPARRLSAQERRNPYLNKQAEEYVVYEQAVVTKNVLTQVLNTADAQVETWAFHFGEAEKKDLERVKNDRAVMQGLPTQDMMEFAELVKGGETAYSFFTGDEPMPLYNFDCRACDRFDMIRALELLIDEVTALTPETAFTASYLRITTDYAEDEDVDELIQKRRKKRREVFERSFVKGDDVTKGRAAREATLTFLYDFCDIWVPKLVRGDDRSAVGKEMYRHAPGMKEIRPAHAGVDAEVVFEALWEYQQEAAYEIKGGGELVLPRLLGERLREIRAAVAADSKHTLQTVVAPEIRSARLAYTDYVEEDDDGMGTYERFKNAADEEGERESYDHKAIIAEMGY